MIIAISLLSQKGKLVDFAIFSPKSGHNRQRVERWQSGLEAFASLFNKKKEDVGASGSRGSGKVVFA
jgi:hypothetical protein